jgi:aspartate-semialdehyde dehydrogenase
MSALGPAVDGVRVAVVGATGAVGTVMLRLLAERGFPASEIVAFASARSAGRVIEAPGLGSLPVRALEEGEAIAGFDLALFSAGGGISGEWAPRFAETGCVVVDNSSRWRMQDDVPLVVTEVNAHALAAHRGIVANPNCTTMAAMLPLKALHDAFGLVSMVATSYQAAGGAGQKGMDELLAQVGPLAAVPGDLIDHGARAAALAMPSVHARTLAFNVVPWLGSDAGGGYSDEEMKLQNESRKILELPSLGVSPTCVRVPVMVGHAVAVRATFSSEVTVSSASSALAAFPGVVVEDVPTPLEWAGRDEVAVGRIRVDLGDPRSLNFFLVNDNLRKGAALNTVQIAEELVARKLVGNATGAPA